MDIILMFNDSGLFDVVFVSLIVVVLWGIFNRNIKKGTILPSKAGYISNHVIAYLVGSLIVYFVFIFFLAALFSFTGIMAASPFYAIGYILAKWIISLIIPLSVASLFSWLMILIPAAITAGLSSNQYDKYLKINQEVNKPISNVSK